MFQATLNAAISLKGIGAHSGNLCEVSILPAKENSGIVFVHRDMDGSLEADYRNVTETMMCTKLSGNNVSVATVEHLMAALYGTGISNAIIQTSGGEIPLLDGSAEPFVKKILSAGIQKQSQKRKILKVLRTIRVEDGTRWSSLSPSDSLVINIKCDYEKNGLKTTPVSFNFSTEDFTTEIAPARTFGFFSDIEFLRKNNLARGVSLENSLVFDEKGCPLNEGKLRFPDEPVRHKILDIIGDLSLSRCKILGRFDGFCTGHKMNNKILNALFENPDNFAII